MKLCGEELKELEELHAQQCRIWPDSADVGIIILENGIRQNEKVRDAIRRIIKTFIGDGLLQQHTTWGTDKTGKGNNWDFFLPIEIDGPNMCGYHINLGWSCFKLTSPNRIEYLTIDIYAEDKPLSSLERT